MANIIVNPGAIDKLQSDVGDVSNLTTSAKNSLVAAVNEHEGDITSLNGNMLSGAISTSTNNSDILGLAPGTYRYGNTCTNKPKNGNGYVAIIKRDNNTKLAIAVADDGTFFTNIEGSGTWVGWKEYALSSSFATVTGTHTFSCSANTWSDGGSENYSAPTGFSRTDIIAIDAHVSGAYWARVVATRANNDNSIVFSVWNNTALTNATIEYKITFRK